MSDTKAPWLTIRDAYDGIETLLLDGPKPMAEICKYAETHGSTNFDTAGFVRALVTANRLEVVIRPFSLDHPSGVYRLTESNLAIVKVEVGTPAKDEDM